MSMQATDTSVQTSVVVDAPIDRAFSFFTEDMNIWWPPDHHILEGELAEMRFEPRAGGRVYDVGVDGSECTWAHVLAFDPPNAFTISWDINPQWKVEENPERRSEVEVRFISESAERTRVELEHRKIDRHGDGWEKMRDAVGSPGGWNGSLRKFAEHVAGA